mmetsp:Transcript_113073/g.283041  ORF Transcript_113073/g.283041 Transcript_113073/m.283041 type:complete len:220 (+) Transcript_113073:83-742(+)
MAFVVPFMPVVSFMPVAVSMLLFELLLLFLHGLHNLLVHLGVANHAVVQMQAVHLEFILDFLQRLELLLLTLPLFVQLQEGFDREGLHELEDDADASDVEEEENQPRTWNCRGFRDRVREHGHVLTQEGDNPHTERSPKVIEIEHEETLFLVLRLLQLRIRGIHDAAPELDAEPREEERDNAEQRHDCFGGGDKVADSLHHELDFLQALQLLQDAQKPQ